MYCRLGIWHIDLFTKLRPGDNLMATHHFKDNDGHPASLGWSPINISLRLVTPYPIALSQKLSPSFPRMVTHQPKLLQSDKT